MKTDKTPLIEIASVPLEIWYEGPTFVVADKPAGMAVHPENAQGRGTLVNALLQSNRWLAEMETSVSPGVIHRLADEDRGLVIVAKTDEMAETLRAQYKAGALKFSYRVRLHASVKTRAEAPVTVFDRRVYQDGTAVMDIDSSVGDTRVLRSMWLLGDPGPVYFVLYRLEVPMGSRVMSVAMGSRMWLPDIELYTAPP